MPELEKEVEIQEEYTEIEQQAMADGWIPPDRFDKSEQGKDFISAEDYVKNGSFFKKINAQKKEIDSLKSTVTSIMEHNQKAAEKERKILEASYKQEIDRLKAEKVKALDEADHARVVEIDEQISNTKKPEAETQKTDIFDKWVAENEWYNNDRILRTEAIKIGEILNSDGLYGMDLFKAVEEHIKELFPNKFKNEKRESPAGVEGGGSPKPAGKAITVNSLTAEEKQVYNDFERMGVFKTDEMRKKYIKEVIDLRD